MPRIHPIVAVVIVVGLGLLGWVIVESAFGHTLPGYFVNVLISALITTAAASVFVRRARTPKPDRVNRDAPSVDSVRRASTPESASGDDDPTWAGIGVAFVAGMAVLILNAMLYYNLETSGQESVWFIGLLSAGVGLLGPLLLGFIVGMGVLMKIDTALAAIPAGILVIVISYAITAYLIASMSL